MKNALGLTLACTLTLAACGGDSPETDAMPADETPAMSAGPVGTVSILSPAEGSEVEGSSVTVELSVSGFPIVEAGDMTVGTGHHHLYLDADLTPASEPVPTVEGSIIHMGDGSSTYTFENVAPGEHRLIAVVADGAHFPLQPWVVDTVTFRVP
ncbi:MAG: DUF4399 domain-containing protein [Gemmatimonadota bacterium]